MLARPHHFLGFCVCDLDCLSSAWLPAWHSACGLQHGIRLAASIGLPQQGIRLAASMPFGLQHGIRLAASIAFSLKQFSSGLQPVIGGVLGMQRMSMSGPSSWLRSGPNHSLELRWWELSFGQFSRWFFSMGGTLTDLSGFRRGGCILMAYRNGQVWCAVLLPHSVLVVVSSAMWR